MVSFLLFHIREDFQKYKFDFHKKTLRKSIYASHKILVKRFDGEIGILHCSLFLKAKEIL